MSRSGSKESGVSSHGTFGESAKPRLPQQQSGQATQGEANPKEAAPPRRRTSNAAKAFMEALEVRRASNAANACADEETETVARGDIEAQVRVTFEYLQDIDERLSGELSLLSQSMVGMLASMELLTKSSNACGSASSSAIGGRGNSRAATSAAPMQPKIGRPASQDSHQERHMSQALTRTLSQLGNLLSDPDGEAQSAAASAATPSPVGGNKHRRNSDASVIGHLTRTGTGGQLQIPSAVPSRRPSNASQFVPPISLGSPRPRRPSADMTGVLDALARKSSSDDVQRSNSKEDGQLRLFHKKSGSYESLHEVSLGRGAEAEAIAISQARGRRPSNLSHASDLGGRYGSRSDKDVCSNDDITSNRSGIGSDDEDSDSPRRTESPKPDRLLKPTLRAQFSLCPDAMNALTLSDAIGSPCQSVASRRVSEVTRASLNLAAANEQAEKSHRCIIRPSDSVRIAFDLLVVMVTIGATILAPLGYVYFGAHGDIASEVRSDSLRLKRSADGFLHFADALWILEILLNFRTAYASRGTFISDWRLIASRYARTWLAIDIVAAWPLILSPPGSEGPMMFIKLLRVGKMIHLLDKLQKELRWSALLPIKVLLIVLLPAHLFACGWRMAVRSDDASHLGNGYGEATDLWWEVYIKDTYWVMMTVTTVGYGDIYPQGMVGRILAIFTMTLAPFFNGAIVSLLTHLTKGFFGDEVQEQVVEASKFMRNRGVPVELQRRVEHNLRLQLKQEKSLGFASALLTKLSPSMQRELTLELLSNTMLNFPLFFGAPCAFIADIAQAHTFVQCNAGDLVVEAGQLEQEIVFVVIGCLILQRAPQLHMGTIKEFGDGAGSDEDDDDVSEAAGQREILAGAWFGEASLFNDGCVRGSTIFAREDTELAVLQSSDYYRIVRKYPQLMERHASLVAEIQAGRLQLGDLAHVPTSSRSVPRVRRIWDYLKRRGSNQVYDISAFDNIGPPR